MSEHSTSTTRLSITFAGLCLLVQDGNPGKLHVLLPGGSGHGKGHEAHLYFNTRHLAGGAAPEGMCVFPLYHTLMDLSFLSGDSDAATHGASRVAHLGCITPKPVPRSFIDGNFPGHLVKTRITLDAGNVKDANQGARWNLKNCVHVWMPTWIEWVIEGLPDDGFTLPLAGLNGDVGAGEVRLHPLNREINLFVFHSPSDRLPVVLPKHPLGEPMGKPATGTKAPHFKAFYPLVGELEDAHPYPELDGDGGVGARSETSQRAVPAEDHDMDRSDLNANDDRVSRGFDYTCMLATAMAEPMTPGGLTQPAVQ